MSLRDALARVTRSLDALQDGDAQFARELLEDLAHELWRTIEREERAA